MPAKDMRDASSDGSDVEYVYKENNVSKYGAQF